MSKGEELNDGLHMEHPDALGRNPMAQKLNFLLPENRLELMVRLFAQRQLTTSRRCCL